MNYFTYKLPKFNNEKEKKGLGEGRKQGKEVVSN